ncbi:DUF6216 family protein [Xylella fastidiosa]|uniref:DUF6216 family protein n=1 Tax=Xylella fastidiosa TaxID=2371 RepID=UPI000423A3C6|nr:DUF6216 family protein [Xylella fastidiosa]ALR03143.1 hypothetical protein OY18_10010 [Xylella fastidiosa]MDG5824166.1 DUF6216 family protein [Xylella fastidiosa subsp. pauca]MDG5824556.1 DUF6216 family protein [Xylella fastidiosa subsp. pauca]NRP54199.1 hypothetical protein [Xylella fastidiosa]NRP67906.1 hypothetical protein [Xylella fastidiosa]
MDYVDILSEKTITILIFICLLVLAAIHISWRVRSFYPIHMRLLRLFISKSDIEDPVICKHLSNQAALITFRMAFGIQCRTLRDAKKVANFAESKNISLNLIGKAGAAFDLNTCSINKKKVPKRISCVLLFILSMILIFAAFMSGVFATSNRLLGQLNETGTWILLSENEARIGSSFFNLFGRNETINIQNCNAKEIVTEKRLNNRDHQIICGIWNSASIKKSLQKSINGQQKALIILMIVLLWFFIDLINTTKNWYCAIQLNSMLRSKS